MSYAIDVLDASKTKVAELTGMVLANLHEKINDISLLTVETIEKSKWEFVTVGTTFLRLRTTEGSAYGTYRVMELKKSRIRERSSLTITARHILADTVDEVFAEAIDCIHYLPSELANLVLGYSGFNVGIVEPAASIPYVRFEYDSVMDCLLKICSLTGGELALDEENNAVDIKNSIGNASGAVLRYGLNLKETIRTINTSRLANRVYGVGGGNPPLTLNSATSSGGYCYTDDTSSIGNYGLREATYHEPTLEDVTNHVATPAFDGIYTNGLCENWVKTGSPTVGKNTDPQNYLYGLSSQHVQTTASGEGIQQDVTVTPGKIYSLLANIFLSAGTVRVEVVDGTSVYKRAEAVTGTGLVSVRIENWKANNAAVTIKIVQEGEGSADFYADSVQIDEGARVKPFTIGKSADTLRDHTVEYLNTYKEPEITYEVSLVDVRGNSSGVSGTGNFGLGDTITVIDSMLDLDVETRVMERTVDILRPQSVKVRLDNPVRSLADILSAIRSAQQEGIKRTRTALAESSTAAETGSVRLGFSNQSLRFYGTITPATWNSVSWTSGTLRVGNGYYAITAGSAASLAESSTYYFYFDRNDPTEFAGTTDMNSAEGDDRILAFAVTTTSSPTLCNIHPLGIIHG